MSSVACAYSLRDTCRLCESRFLMRVLDLAYTPLANEFPKEPGQPQDEFPLFLESCLECGHVQLPVVVDPERLFRDYVYVSGTSPVFREHFRKYADDTIKRHNIRESDLVVEIGSNDASLLRCFKHEGMRVLGIDPARDIAAKATADGFETWPEFFTPEIAGRIVRERGKAKLVVANNVFAHADDLASIARGVKTLLADDGAFVFEVSYLLDVLEKTLFDTAYHEHASMHAVEPLVGFFRRLGMSLRDARRVDTHGGSIRVTVSPKPDQSIHHAALDLIMKERALGLGREPRAAFEKLGRTIEQRRQELRCVVDTIKNQGGSIAGYGAPAKATTLLYTFGLEHSLDHVVDDSPHKQHRWLPGGHTPVLPSTALEGSDRPDAVIILAWNFAESILEKLSAYRAAGGKCIVPLPTLRIV